MDSASNDVRSDGDAAAAAVAAVSGDFVGPRKRGRKSKAELAVASKKFLLSRQREREAQAVASAAAAAAASAAAASSGSPPQVLYPTYDDLRVRQLTASGAVTASCSGASSCTRSLWHPTEEAGAMAVAPQSGSSQPSMPSQSQSQSIGPARMSMGTTPFAHAIPGASAPPTLPPPRTAGQRGTAPVAEDNSGSRGGSTPCAASGHVPTPLHRETRSGESSKLLPRPKEAPAARRAQGGIWVQIQHRRKQYRSTAPLSTPGLTQPVAPEQPRDNTSGMLAGAMPHTRGDSSGDAAQQRGEREGAASDEVGGSARISLRSSREGVPSASQEVPWWPLHTAHPGIQADPQKYVSSSRPGNSADAGGPRGRAGTGSCNEAAAGVPYKLGKATFAKRLREPPQAGAAAAGAALAATILEGACARAAVARAGGGAAPGLRAQRMGLDEQNAALKALAFLNRKVGQGAEAAAGEEETDKAVGDSGHKRKRITREEEGGAGEGEGRANCAPGRAADLPPGVRRCRVQEEGEEAAPALASEGAGRKHLLARESASAGMKCVPGGGAGPRTERHLTPLEAQLQELMREQHEQQALLLKLQQRRQEHQLRMAAAAAAAADAEEGREERSKREGAGPQNLRSLEGDGRLGHRLNRTDATHVPGHPGQQNAAGLDRTGSADVATKWLSRALGPLADAFGSQSLPGSPLKPSRGRASTGLQDQRAGERFADVHGRMPCREAGATEVGMGQARGRVLRRHAEWEEGEGEAPGSDIWSRAAEGARTVAAAEEDGTGERLPWAGLAKTHQMKLLKAGEAALGSVVAGHPDSEPSWVSDPRQGEAEGPREGSGTGSSSKGQPLRPMGKRSRHLEPDEEAGEGAGERSAFALGQVLPPSGAVPALSWMVQQLVEKSVGPVGPQAEAEEEAGESNPENPNAGAGLVPHVVEPCSRAPEFPEYPEYLSGFGQPAPGLLPLPGSNALHNSCSSVPLAPSLIRHQTLLPAAPSLPLSSLASLSARQSLPILPSLCPNMSSLGSHPFLQQEMLAYSRMLQAAQPAAAAAAAAAAASAAAVTAAVSMPAGGLPTTCAPPMAPAMPPRSSPIPILPLAMSSLQHAQLSLLMQQHFAGACAPGSGSLHGPAAWGQTAPEGGHPWSCTTGVPGGVPAALAWAWSQGQARSAALTAGVGIGSGGLAAETGAEAQVAREKLVEAQAAGNWESMGATGPAKAGERRGHGQQETEEGEESSDSRPARSNSSSSSFVDTRGSSATRSLEDRNGMTFRVEEGPRQHGFLHCPGAQELNSRKHAKSTTSCGAYNEEYMRLVSRDGDTRKGDRLQGLVVCNREPPVPDQKAGILPRLDSSLDLDLHL